MKGNWKGYLAITPRAQFDARKDDDGYYIERNGFTVNDKPLDMNTTYHLLLILQAIRIWGQARRNWLIMNKNDDIKVKGCKVLVTDREWIHYSERNVAQRAVKLLKTLQEAL